MHPRAQARTQARRAVHGAGGGKQAEPGSLLQRAEGLLVGCWLGFLLRGTYGERFPESSLHSSPPPQLDSLWQLWIGKLIQFGEGCGGGFAPARWQRGWCLPGAPGSPRFGAS